MARTKVSILKPKKKYFDRHQRDSNWFYIMLHWLEGKRSNRFATCDLLLMFVFIERVNAASTQWFRRERKRKYQYVLSRPITGQVHRCEGHVFPQLTLRNFNTYSKNTSGNNSAIYLVYKPLCVEFFFCLHKKIIFFFKRKSTKWYKCLLKTVTKKC